MSQNQENQISPSEAQRRDDEPTSFFSIANLKIAQVNIVSGTLNGYSIGFVGVYTTLYGFSTNCAKYTNAKPCTTLSNSHCQWIDATPTTEAYCT